jgi:hypothetical protein
MSAYYINNKLNQENLVLVNKAIYYAYYNIYLANLSPLNLGIDNTLENKLGGCFKIVDR